MTVFISFAPSDREVAEGLEKFIERRGQFAELDDGLTAQRPVQPSDVVILLLSKDFIMAPSRLRLEQRALDAWSDGRLIVVKLDTWLAPVGMRDLPAVDASFEPQREFKWQEVANAVLEKLKPAAPGAAAPDRPAQKPSGGWLAAVLALFRKRPQGKSTDTAPTETVFVSYARLNQKQVLPVIEAAQGDGRTFWLDQHGLKTGDGWAGEIVRAIKNSASVVVMCSQAAFESDHVKREVYLADRYRKRLSPVYIEQVDPPEDFEYFFVGVQSLNLFETPEGERGQAFKRALGATG
jgi:TIR domain